MTWVEIGATREKVVSGSVENQLTVSIFPGDKSTIGPTLKIDGKKVTLEDGTGTETVGSKRYLPIDSRKTLSIDTTTGGVGTSQSSGVKESFSRLRRTILVQ